MRNCAAYATQATRNADANMLGNVQSAASAVPPACVAERSSFRHRMGVQLTMARDQMKSASLHSFHESHTDPTAAVRSPFQTLVHEMLEQLGEDPKREGLRQTPARVEASLKGLPRVSGVGGEEVVRDRAFLQAHERRISLPDIHTS